MKSLITKALSLRVKPTVLPSDPSSIFTPGKQVLYVLESASRTDRAALEIICNQYQLPSPAAGFRYGGVDFSDSVISLKHRRHRLFGKAGVEQTGRFGELLQGLSVDVQSGEQSRQQPGDLQASTHSGKQLQEDLVDCLMVPVSVYWGQEPDREDSFWKIYFSEYWEIAGRTRKFLMSLVHGRHTLLRFSEPISLRDFLTQDPSAAVLERKLLRILRVHFRRRRRATLGPDLSHRRMLLQHVVADLDVREAVRLESDKQSLSNTEVFAAAQDNANEIAADMSYRTVRLMHRLLRRLWTRLYDGVQLNGLSRLDAVVEGSEIIYVPCHRSHIDYLLLSYILYVNGYSLPHIAAGINLNLPVVGGILRRGGAFFLRRTFAGDRVYAAVFNTYLKELIQRGYALEYFLEGGRSRSGYLLPAKPGMLSMTVQAYLKEPVRPVYFVPVYFGYERLLEGRAFTRELAGGRKRGESLLGLFKSIGTLREDYGHVHVNIGQPIGLGGALDKQLGPWREHPDAVLHSDAYRKFIATLGRDILTGINAAASVTPVSLVATVLLSSPGKTIGREEANWQLRILHELMLQLYPESLVVLPERDAENWVAQAQSLGFLEQSKDELGDLVRVIPRQTASLTYFSNNIAHLLVVPSLIASVLRERRTVTDESLVRLLERAWPFLCAEYFLAQNQHRDSLARSVEAMLKTGLIQRDSSGGLARPTGGTTESVALFRLSQVLMPTIERYFLASSLLAGVEKGINKGDFEIALRRAAKRYALTEARDVNTLFSKPYYRMLLDSLRETGGIRMEGERIHATAELEALGHEIPKVLPDVARHAILAAVRPVVADID